MLAGKSEDAMKNARWIPALLLIAVATGYAQTKNPVSSALREILPGRQKNTVAAVEAMPAGGVVTPFTEAGKLTLTRLPGVALSLL